MTGLLICAAVAVAGAFAMLIWADFRHTFHDGEGMLLPGLISLALIAVALWLAYAAGGQP